MHETLVVLEHGHARARSDPADELLAAARDDQVDEAGELQERRDRLAVGGVDELDRVGGPARFVHGLGEHGRDHRVRLDRLAPAPKDRRVARLEAQAGGVGGHVRPRLVDEADDTQRDADARDLDAARPPPRLHQRPDGVRERGDLAQPLRHLLDAGLGQRQAIEERPRRAPGPRPFDVDSVGLEQRRALLDEPVGHLRERVVLDLRRAERQHARGVPGGAGLGLHEVADVAGAGHLSGLDYARAGAPRSLGAERGTLLAVQLQHAQPELLAGLHQLLERRVHKHAAQLHLAAQSCPDPLSLLERGTTRTSVIEDHPHRPRPQRGRELGVLEIRDPADLHPRGRLRL